jgi:hypothetical protein
MGIDDDMTDLVAVGVEKPKATGSFGSLAKLLRTGVSDNDALAAGVVTDIVGVVGELGRRQNLKSFAVEACVRLVRLSRRSLRLCRFQRWSRKDGDRSNRR